MITMASFTTAFTINTTGSLQQHIHSHRAGNILTIRESSTDSVDQESDPTADTSASTSTSTSTSTPLSASTPGVDLAWRHVSKPMLRIGSKGVSATHANSLGELLEAHTCVKVKINTHKLGSLEEAFVCIQNVVVENNSSSNIELIHVRKSDNMIMIGKEGALDMIRAGDFPPPPPVEDDDADADADAGEE